MSTVPEKRVNKNGHLVTKHVNPDKGATAGTDRIKRLPSWSSPINGKEMHDESPLVTDLMRESRVHTGPIGRTNAQYLRLEDDKAVYGVSIDLMQVGEALLGGKQPASDIEEWHNRCWEAVQNYGVHDIVDRVAQHYGGRRGLWDNGFSVEFDVPYPDGNPEGVSESFMNSLASDTTNVAELFSQQDHDNLVANIKDIVSVPADWTLVSSGLYDPERPVTVKNPEGTAEYTVRVETQGVNKGDVYVELSDLESGLKGEFRAFLGNPQASSEGGEPRIVKMYQAPSLPHHLDPDQTLKPVADFKKFSDDDAVIERLVRVRL